jgi:hypothetical protein
MVYISINYFDAADSKKKFSTYTTQLKTGQDFYVATPSAIWCSLEIGRYLKTTRRI